MYDRLQHVFAPENFRAAQKLPGKLDSFRRPHHQRLILHNNAVRDLGHGRGLHDDVSAAASSRPLAHEPTSDGVASVLTFFVQMPECAAAQKASGQSLIRSGVFFHINFNYEFSISFCLAKLSHRMHSSIQPQHQKKQN
jgi:hypothetical protein